VDHSHSTCQPLFPTKLTLLHALRHLIINFKGDPNSTNIFIASIHPIVTEDDLQEKFGSFGPLASIKIMYPRSEEEKRKERNCAFVAFCCRK